MRRKYQGPWPVKARETEDYPNLVVDDGRVTGSITDGHSRLPLWAFVGEMTREGYPRIVDNWPPHVLDAEQMGAFLYNLLEQRGEFGRLLCVLADVERREEFRDWAWWQRPSPRRRVIRQLQHCLDALREEEAASEGASPPEEKA